MLVGKLLTTIYTSTLFILSSKPAQTLYLKPFVAGGIYVLLMLLPRS